MIWFIKNHPNDDWLSTAMFGVLSSDKDTSRVKEAWSDWASAHPDDEDIKPVADLFASISSPGRIAQLRSMVPKSADPSAAAVSAGAGAGPARPTKVDEASSQPNQAAAPAGTGGSSTSHPNTEREDQALKLDPNNVYAHDNLLRIYCDTGRSASAACLNQLLWFIDNHPENQDLDTKSFGMTHSPASMKRLKSAWNKQSNNPDASLNIKRFEVMSNPQIMSQLLALNPSARQGPDMKPEAVLPPVYKPKYPLCQSPKLIKSADMKLDIKWEDDYNAISSRNTGTVGFELYILPDGTIAGGEVTRGHPSVQRAAITAVNQWRYAPVPKTCSVLVELAPAEPIPQVSMFDRYAVEHEPPPDIGTPK